MSLKYVRDVPQCISHRLEAPPRPEDPAYRSGQVSAYLRGGLFREGAYFLASIECLGGASGRHGTRLLENLKH